MPASLTGAQRGWKSGDGGRRVGTQEVAGFRGKGEKQCLPNCEAGSVRTPCPNGVVTG